MEPTTTSTIDTLVSDPSMPVDGNDKHFEETSDVLIQNALTSSPPPPGLENYSYPMQATATELPQPWQFNYNNQVIPQQQQQPTATAAPQPGPGNYYNPAIQQQLPPSTATGPFQPWLMNYNNIPWNASMPSSTTAEQQQPWQMNYNHPVIPQQLPPSSTTGPPQSWLMNYSNPWATSVPPTSSEQPHPWQLNYNYPAINPQFSPQPWLHYYNSAIEQLPPSTSYGPPQPWSPNYNNPGITPLPPPPQPWQLNYNNPGIAPLQPPYAGNIQPQPWSLIYNYPPTPELPPQSAGTEPPQSSLPNYNYPSNPPQLPSSDAPGPPLPTEQQQLNNDYSAGNQPTEQHPLNNNNPPSIGTVPPPQTDEVNLKKYSELHQAAIKGDWEAADGFFKRDQDSISARITISRGTVLHVAAINGHSHFLEKLVTIVNPESVLVQDSEGRTALHYIAVTGSVTAAKAIVYKNSHVLHIKDSFGDIPIATAAAFGRSKYVTDMLTYLCSVTLTDPPEGFLAGETAAKIINNIVALGHYEIALSVLRLHPSLATIMDQNSINLLHSLLADPSLFSSGNRLGFWQQCIYPFVSLDPDFTQMPLKQDDSLTQVVSTESTNMQPSSVQNSSSCKDPRWFNQLWRMVLQLIPGVKIVYTAKSRHKNAMKLLEFVCMKVMDMNSTEIHKFLATQGPVHQATANGVVEMVELCLKFVPDLIWINFRGLTLCHYAIAHRHHKLFNLTYNISSQRSIMSFYDSGANNSLHLAAMLAPEPQLNSNSGCALQMQRELQWFKMVEKLVFPVCKLSKNKNGQTPHEVFSKQHKDLLEKEERWMKDTANSCMVVSTLIATIAFAGAFTVPGGNDDEKGIPIFLRTNSFVVFAISDALALLSSTTSLLIFLAVLTSRYAEDDFLVTLPRKLIMGLASLFVAIATMMAAFGAALSIALDDTLRWMFIPVIVLASVPVILFLRLQLPLLVQIVRSTFGPGISVTEIN